MNTTLYRVLIIDDNPEFVKSLINLIKDVAGKSISKIECAYNGFEGLEMIRDHDFDYVFMDINMQTIDGIEATRFVRFEYDKPGMKIIGISFNSGVKYKSQMMHAGADSYLIKDEIDADRIAEIFNLS